MQLQPIELCRRRRGRGSHLPCGEGHPLGPCNATAQLALGPSEPQVGVGDHGRHGPASHDGILDRRIAQQGPRAAHRVHHRLRRRCTEGIHHLPDVLQGGRPDVQRAVRRLVDSLLNLICIVSSMWSSNRCCWSNLCMNSGCCNKLDARAMEMDAVVLWMLYSKGC